MSILFQLVALSLMATDAAESGFGLQTLWIAPPVLGIGLILPIYGLMGKISIEDFISRLKLEPLYFVGGFLAFIIALTTYSLTLEPTASLWDCSETIATAYKLQVPHTPGIPLTMLMGRLFSMLVLGDVTQVAWFINFMSAIFSALAVSIIYLIIWYFGKAFTQSKWILFLGSLGGSMVLTFSDTFWFSAVEAETYGPSCFFMVLLIWLTIQGKELTGSERTNRILLIAYLTGLSYCIHPMCILILPVCFLIWKSDSFKNKWMYIGYSTALGIGAILLINKVIAVDFFEWTFKLDLFLVNSWSFPFYSGLFLLIACLIGGWILVWYKFSKARLTLLVLLLLTIGFSPYLMLFVRSSKLPPINEFSPKNLAMIKPYMNRESYPGRPLLYGPYFDAKINLITKKADSYITRDDHYQKVGEISEYHYEDNRKTILPRIYSDDPSHIDIYREWTGLRPEERPRFSDNLVFMIRYQLGHMYFRYLMWNFAGRASDVQHARWLSPVDGLPDRSGIEYNKANNQYFLLPFLFALIGLIWQYKKDEKGFIINLAFFLITGLLLAGYLNATPNEPRERDYIYAGSYMAFAIWIGLGMIVVTKMIPANWRIGAWLFCIGTPIWMLYQNLDDHNRSDRTFQVDHAWNLLGSCGKNAILFTGGDNDTFPLWYLQEVEGFRTDVRVKVLSYFNADWYINQLTRSYYDSPPFQLELTDGEQYGPFNPLYVHETMDKPISLDKYLKALQLQSPQLKVKTSSGGDAFYLPSRQITLSTSKGPLDISVNGSYLPKSELAILDLIMSNDWNRPVYFNFTSLNSLNIDLRSYLVQEGLLYRLRPEKSDTGDVAIDLDKSYENLVLNADYSNLSNSKVYFNHEDYESRMILPLKFTLNTLIENYISNENGTRAQEVALFTYNNLYYKHLEPSYADLQLGHYLNSFGFVDEAQQLVSRLFDFTFNKVAQAVHGNQSVSRNDWIVLQGAVRFLDDEELLNRYESLIKYSQQ
ncbi:MAG: DUF2723 domain-containing protein [Bacteroidota bacterium]